MGSKLERSCGCSQEGRNLVVCIDGSGKKFSIKNSNVVELYSHILASPTDNQLTYYDSGIGTLAKPSRTSLSYLTKAFLSKIDLALAWNLSKVILEAYRWLSNNYRPGDKIFLFGFSRGAYQVRALAGMIHTVGLIRPGNEAQIPFAFELYSNYEPEGKTNDLVENFKKTFSSANGGDHVRVHFVGVWDTVSSVGFHRGKKMLPGIADLCGHICIFRHALALDERRVKFAPEYVHEGVSHTVEHPRTGSYRAENGICSRISILFKGRASKLRAVGGKDSDIKEVWFAGSHSDIGGGNRENITLDLGHIPLLWMRHEAIVAGLRLKLDAIVEWNPDELDRKPEKSLKGGWWLLECLPVRRLSYKDKSDATDITFMPNKGRYRKIVQGQKIHISVICKPNYRPKQAFPPHTDKLINWPELLYFKTADFRVCVDDLPDTWDKGLFDMSAVHCRKEDVEQAIKADIQHMSFISAFVSGRNTISKICNVQDILRSLLTNTNTSRAIRMHAAITLCELESAKESVADEKDLADAIITSKCLDMIMDLSESDATKILTANAIPSLLKNGCLRPKLVQKPLVQALFELWKSDANNRVRAPGVLALSHLMEHEEARNFVACGEVLNKLQTDMKNNRFSDTIAICTSTMLVALAKSDDNRRIIVGPEGLSVVVEMMDTKRHPSVLAAYIKVLLSLAYEYSDTGDMKSYTPLFPAFERILRIADPSLIMAAVKTLWKLLDHSIGSMSKFVDILINRLRSKTKQTWTSCFNALKFLAEQGGITEYGHKSALVGTLVKKTDHWHSYSDATHALSTLPHDDDMRRAFIESDFAALFLRGIKSGANSSCLLAALNLLLNDEEIRTHIKTDVISPLVAQISRGNIFSIAFAYECIRPSLLNHEYFRNALLELKLIGALQKVVAHKSYLLLPVAVSILCVLNSYDDARAAILSSGILPALVGRSKKHPFLQKHLLDTGFHVLFANQTCAIIAGDSRVADGVEPQTRDIQDTEKESL